MTGAIPGAINWVQILLTGTIATSIAVVAVATLALLMLRGQISSQRGALIVMGCFVLFSAPVISGALTSTLKTSERRAVTIEAPQMLFNPLASSPTRPPMPYDPYAGAALPSRGIGDQDLLPAGR